MAKPMSPEVFWSKVDKSNCCWVWNGAVGKSGYGIVGYQYRNWLAHRLAYFFTFGDIPDGMCICHSCDNKLCVNPSHLWIGTYAQNSHDMVSKGRSAKGDRSSSKLHPNKLERGEKHWSKRMPERTRKGIGHHKAKITDDQVRAIRQRVKSGETMISVASSVGVHVSTVSLIVKNKTWTHVK